MNRSYANDYKEIPAALAHNDPLRRRTVALVESDPILGKAFQGPGRTEAFRDILRELALGRLIEGQAIRRTNRELPRHQSPHAASNRVFPSSWEERLIRMQFSRFYNQAVLEELIERGEEHCFVEHSSAEDSDTPCSTVLAGRTHRVEHLHRLLVEAYAQEQYSREPRIPNHPHCTHVVRPL